MKNLPFDMKKVMTGNKKEIEKYLKYIEKYPDRAVELGVPLDIMGTSRGDGFGILNLKIHGSKNSLVKKRKTILTENLPVEITVGYSGLSF
jgi:hypothetical protein